jgi:hypothetical protein
MVPRYFAAAVGAAAMVWSVAALADKVATLPARGPAPMAERANIRAASETASKALGHTTITEQDIVQGEAAAGDKAGTSEGMIAIGKTTGADWVVEPTVASNEYGTNVELKVCQVASGRIETLSRDLDPKLDATSQITEMLLLMLRPQGLGDDPLPWAKKKDEKAKPPPEVLPKPKPAPVAPPLVWGEHGKISIGAAGGIGSLVVRDERATKAPRFYAWTLHGNVAIPSVKGLEVTVRFGGTHGPGTGIGGDVGARYMIAASSFAIGVGANLGGFGALGSGIAGVTLGLDPTLSLAIAKPLQIDLAWKNRYVPAAEPLLFTSAELAILARF